VGYVSYGHGFKQYEDYRPLLPKIRENEKDITQNLGIIEVLRMNRCVNNKLKSAGGYLWKKI
jgi:hypothetical protein